MIGTVIVDTIRVGILVSAIITTTITVESDNTHLEILATLVQDFLTMHIIQRLEPVTGLVIVATTNQGIPVSATITTTTTVV